MVWVIGQLPILQRDVCRFSAASPASDGLEAGLDAVVDEVYCIAPMRLRDNLGAPWDAGRSVWS